MRRGLIKTSIGEDVGPLLGDQLSPFPQYIVAILILFIKVADAVSCGISSPDKVNNWYCIEGMVVGKGVSECDVRCQRLD